MPSAAVALPVPSPPAASVAPAAAATSAAPLPTKKAQKSRPFASRASAARKTSFLDNEQLFRERFRVVDHHLRTSLVRRMTSFTKAGKRIAAYVAAVEAPTAVAQPMGPSGRQPNR